MRTASRSVAWARVIPPATLLLVSLLAAGPLWGPGLLNTRGGGDSPFLLLRTHQLAANLRDGVFPARWMPDAAYGFGYPFFSYYAALPYYLAAGFDLLGVGVLSAIKLTQTLFLAAAALAMYAWAGGILHSRPGAWLAAVAYTVAPFHLVNLYVRGDSLSEFAAFAFYPLILWGLDRLTGELSMRRALLPAVAYAGLIVTHNASALIFTPFILLYVAIHIAGAAGGGPHRPGAGSLLRHSALVVPLILALLLSAWFWLPALAETQYAQLDAQTTGYFFYGNHFRGIDLVQGAVLFDYATGPGTGSPFTMGLVQTILALGGVLSVAVRWLRLGLSTRRSKCERVNSQTRTRRLGIRKPGFALVGLLLSTWMITPLSQVLWDSLPLLRMIQFPWRFLSIQALFTALFTGAAISHLGSPQRYLGWACAVAAAALLTTTALAGLNADYLPITDGDVTPDRLQLYELFTGNIGSTIRHEYLPRWVKPRPYIGPQQFSPDVSPRAIPISGAVLSAERVDRRPTRRLWQVETGSEGSSVAFPLYYWPGWYATVDGRRVAVEPAAGSGYVSLDIPAGSHAVEMRLGRTPLRLGAELVSLVTALSMVALCIGQAIREREKIEREDGRTKIAEPESTIRYLQAAIVGLPFVVLLSVVTAFHPRVTATSSDDLTMDFADMAYLHHNPEGMLLDGWRMTSYSYQNSHSAPTDRIAPGETLEVTLDWKREEGGLTTAPGEELPRLRLMSPAAVRRDGLPAAAEAGIGLSHQSGTSDAAFSTTASVAVPKGTPPGMYLLQITHTPALYLRPIWIASTQESTEETVHATFAEGALRLHGVQAAQTAPGQLHVELDWSAAKPVAANYGLSLRLTDTAGNEWLHQGDQPGYDTQPGHGFLPTSLWPLHRMMNDHHIPSLKAGVPPGETYTLSIDLYYVTDWKSVGQHQTTVSLTQAWERPGAPVVAQFGEELALSHLEIPASVWQGENLAITAYWSAPVSPSADYVVAWRLEGPERSITSTEPLAPGSSPKEWPAGAWVAGRTALRIPPLVPAGAYSVTLTVREPSSGTSIGSYGHPTPVEIQGRDRAWELPEMDRRVGARFGGMIELAGYDLQQEASSVVLTLHWQALTTPDRDYVFFVHLADPGTGEPAAQVDTMPQGFEHPTSQWAPGEVVSDEVRLSTRGVEPKRYDLAVGWYDPASRQRLRALDSDGRPLPDDRLILPTSVRLR